MILDACDFSIGAMRFKAYLEIPAGPAGMARAVYFVGPVCPVANDDKLEAVSGEDFTRLLTAAMSHLSVSAAASRLVRA